MADRDIWESPDWIERRQEYREYRAWYDGTPLDAVMEKRDKSSGEKVRRYPLDLNLTALACNVHRDIMRGTPEHDDPLVVRAIIERGEQPEMAELLEGVINEGVWGPSHGGPLQQEAMLAMHIYGGTVFKLSWEPWEQDLPYRLAVRLIKNPGHIQPVTDWLNPWKLLECYIGYEIQPAEAQVKYGITVPRGQRTLYMEHWTPTEYKITINDQVPVMKWGSKKFPLEGENPWGVVPVFYVPHERTTKALFGDSLVPRQRELVKEINSRSADLADILRSTRPGLLYGRDIDRTLQTRRVIVDGVEVNKIVDLGRSRPSQSGGGQPDVFSTPVPDIPQALVEYPLALLDFWMMMTRISPAVFGLDDTRSGRITGPAIAQRMWTSVAHAVTGRINFSDTKNAIDRAIISLLVAKGEGGTFGELEIEAPAITRERVGISQSYPCMIPMDAADQHREWMEKLREGGASIENYLAETGESDIVNERGRILTWQKDLAGVKQKEEQDVDRDQDTD